MIQLHATHKLFNKLPLSSGGQLAVTKRSERLHQLPSFDSNPLDNWHGNLVILQRRQCLLFVHDKTRFPLVLPALKKLDFTELNDRFADALMNTLLKSGATHEQLAVIDHYLRPLQVDTICNRSVQGTLNQMKAEFEYWLHYECLNVAEMTGYPAGAWLADTPRNVKDKGYLWPQKEMLALLDKWT
jgi:hypothetical protein